VGIERLDRLSHKVCISCGLSLILYLVLNGFLVETSQHASCAPKVLFSGSTCRQQNFCPSSLKAANAGRPTSSPFRGYSSPAESQRFEASAGWQVKEREWKVRVSTRMLVLLMEELPVTKATLLLKMHLG